MDSKDYINILYPVPWVSKMLHLSISGAMDQNKGKYGLKNELIYFVLPLITHDDVRNELAFHTNVTSSIFTIFEKKMSANQDYSIDLSQRVNAFSNITNIGLVYLGNYQQLEFKNYISVKFSKKYLKKTDEYDVEYQKAAYYLGWLFAKEDYKSIFLKLGVIPQ
jgi:hypothetical protein